MFAYGILSGDVALIDTSVRDLNTSFGGTRMEDSKQSGIAYTKEPVSHVRQSRKHP